MQQDSEYTGTKEFGMCFADQEGRVAQIGTLLRIEEFAHMKASVWLHGSCCCCCYCCCCCC